jgi:hypothetical protein
MKVDKHKCLKAVIGQIENMLYNNEEDMENINESFSDWCEEGEVFDLLDEMNEKEKETCKAYMWKIASVVDSMTNKLYSFYVNSIVDLKESKKKN